MRIDLFLKKTLIIKQREMAQKACKNQLVKLNFAYTKPSKEVKVGDTIEINFPNRILIFKILVIPVGNVSKKKAPELYEVLKDEYREIEF